MRTRRAPAASVIAGLVLLGATVVGAETTEKTLYLHSIAPTNVAEGAVSLVGDPSGPVMDETAPIGPNPKVAVVGPGNGNFRKNFLLSWWRGEVHGTVSDVVVRLFVSASAQARVTVTIFGDGGIGVSPPLGRATVEGIGRGPAELEIPVEMSAPIDSEMVLSVDMGGAGSVLYDSTVTPSSVSFTLGPYAPPPTPVLPLPAAGWDDVSPVHFEKAARESSLALDPTDPDVMLMCDPSGVPNTSEGHSYFYLTTDGGDSWNELDPETPGDTRSYAFEGGDCDVAFDDGGTMYSADTWLGSLSVGSSTDGGTTWSGTALAASSPIVDRPWLVGGPDGTVHVTYQDVQFAMPSAIWYTRSTDRAQTFQPAVLITGAGPDGTHTWTGNFVVAPDGQDLYSVYTRRSGPLIVGGLDDTGPETVWVAASHDGGTTWTQHLVAAMPTPASYLYPSIALDDGGMLHVVFSSKTDEDRPIWYAVSSDQAQTWSEPIKVLAGTSGFSPWVDAGAHGEAVLQWYGSPDPEAVLNQPEDWYIYWARITDAHTGSPTITTGTTTQTPIFTGVQSATPEFNMVRLGVDGKMRIGASAYRTIFGTTAAWAAYFFTES